ncbi:MAG: HAMP domain-containing histidine kinase [Sphingomonas sp.]|uniref:sensor histidine kinase n=1 Tax=Sphingomonas sp. TaxID=28214 RepID=UPI0018221BF3|nr:HAMP domain-containing sensor histidine kinase [Sphingomonas sp.]MBA3667223.1 HAMP domain-containing histidine kinase [Sphingomonas sp.]
MASAPSDRGPVRGRVDAEGRLVSADPDLLRLQEAAGSSLGAPLALPQLAAVVRSAFKLGVPLSRSVIAASADQDFDLWVRAEPDAEGADFSIEGWKSRPPAPPRLTLVGSEPAAAETVAAQSHEFTVDVGLKIAAVDAALAARLGVSESESVGQPLTRFFMLVDDGDGQMPLLTALGGRQDFEGQQATLRSDPNVRVTLSGTAKQAATGRFEGFEGHVDFGGAEGPGEAPGLFDPALDEALRSPLDRIIAAADRIVDRTDGPLRSEYAAYAGDISAAGRHLLSVIRVMTEQPGGDVDRIDLALSVAEAVQLVQARADERDIAIAVAGGASPMPAHAEARATVQILVNIIGNAIRHSPEKTAISIHLETSGGKARVTVGDQGPGIDPADQQRIFERYERVGDAPVGTGLGLAIARRLARSMGGDIELHSARGEGARFTLVLASA